jgi:hypothetical protein
MPVALAAIPHAAPRPNPAERALVPPGFSWSAHVARVTEVSGDKFRIIHGNFDVQLNGTGDDKVAETGFVDIWDDAGTGYPMLGFVSPMAK